MIAALADAGAVLGRDDYLDAARACGRVRAGRDARRRRPAAAHLEGRRGEAQRLPRGPRLPARGAADPLRGDLRGALVRRRARDRRRDDRALRRPRARRLLHHLRRPRGADRPPQGRRRPPDPVGQLVGGLRPAAARGADRRARATSERGRVGVPASSAGSRPSHPAGGRPPAARARLPPLAGPRGRAGRPRRRRRARRAGRGRALASSARTSSSPAGRRAPSAPS